MSLTTTSIHFIKISPNNDSVK